MVYTYKAAFDNGNSSVKGIIRNKETKSTEVQPSLVKPILTLPAFTETSVDNAVANLFDNLIVNITSNALKIGGLYAVGTKAQKLGSARNMNIHVGKKHKDDIPVIASLSMIAAKAVQDDFKEKGSLSSEIEAEVCYSSALPAIEFTPETAKFLEERFTENSHVVQVYAMKKPVTVRLTFKKVKITQEGNPAVFAIISGDEELLADYNKNYESKINRDFQKEKILTIDIGDGTTELIYTVNGKPITEYCKGLQNGVGHAADEANKLLEKTLDLEMHMKRQDFMNAVLDTDNHFNADAQLSMTRATQIKAMDLLVDIQETFQNTLKGDATIFLVIGGGAATFRSALYDDLLEYGKDNDVKLLWVPDKYAALINVLGLDFLNQKLFFK